MNVLPPSFREEWWWWLVAPKGIRLLGSHSQKCADIVAHAGCESRPHVLDSLKLISEEEGEKRGRGEMSTHQTSGLAVSGS